MLGFEGVASVFWSSIVSCAAAEAAVQAAAARFDAPPDRIRRDYQAFRRQCAAHHLLGDEAGTMPPLRRSTSPLPRRVRAALPMLLHAAVTRLRVQAALRKGFNAAYQLAEAESDLRRDCANRFVTDGELMQLMRAFRRADGAMIHRLGVRDCLPRSLALFLFLSERGVPASHVIGLSPRPFRVHAWVEVSGSALLEDGEQIAPFRRLAVLAYGSMD